MTVRFQVSKPVLAGRELEYVIRAVESGWISSTGEYIARFEQSVSRIVGVDDCISVCNGTVALHLACLTMELLPGQEVIVPSLTYVATANAVSYCGATPVLVDCSRETWNLTASAVEAAITPKTVGVIAVHLYGLPCQIEEIAAVCRRSGLWLIEDCAESLGASVRGQQTGSFGDAATFSFYGNKTISTGEGGALVLKEPQKIAKARMLRGQGMDPDRRYWHPVLGYNYRLTNVAAAIGCGQIEQFSYHLGERRRIAASYAEKLAVLEKTAAATLFPVMHGYESSYWLYSLVLTEGGADRRSQIALDLQSKWGIETRPFFVPMHQLPMYRHSAGALSNSEYLGEHGMNLPTYSGLAETEIAEISEAVIEAVMRQ